MVSFLHCCEKSIASDRLTHASVTAPPPHLEVLALPPDLDPEYAGLAGTLRLISLGRGQRGEERDWPLDGDSSLQIWPPKWSFFPRHGIFEPNLSLGSESNNVTVSFYG